MLEPLRPVILNERGPPLLQRRPARTYVPAFGTVTLFAVQSLKTVGWVMSPPATMGVGAGLPGAGIRKKACESSTQTLNWKLPVTMRGLDRTYQQHWVHAGLVFTDRSTMVHVAAGAYEYVDSARLPL